jgi:hypothetical protein
MNSNTAVQALVMTGAMLASTGAWAAKLYVDDDAPGCPSTSPAEVYCTISAALGAAQDGDKIIVAAGSYWGGPDGTTPGDPITVSTSVKLEGPNCGNKSFDPDDRPAISEAVVQGYFEVKASDVSICGFEIAGGKYGVQGLPPEGVTQISEVDISHNIVHSLVAPAIGVHYGLSGCNLAVGHKWRIAHNRFLGAAEAVHLSCLKKIEVKNNQIEDNGAYPILIADIADAKVNRNTMTGGTWTSAVYLGGSRSASDIDISDNSMIPDSSVDGVHVNTNHAPVDDLRVERNDVAGIVIGVAIEPIADQTTLYSRIRVTHNALTASAAGFAMLGISGYASYDGVTVRDNCFGGAESYGIYVDPDTPDTAIVSNEGRVDGRRNFYGAGVTPSSDVDPVDLVDESHPRETCKLK